MSAPKVYAVFACGCRVPAHKTADGYAVRMPDVELGGQHLLGLMRCPKCGQFAGRARFIYPADMVGHGESATVTLERP